MLDILMRAGSFAAIILLGHGLKKIGFFKQEDFALLSKITIRITLPAAIITSYAGKMLDPSLLTLALMGFGCGVVYIITGWLWAKKQGREAQAFAMLNLPGYNIGAFVIPFAQSFLGPVGVIATGLFDTGNAVICLGGAFSIASMVKNGTGFSVKRIMVSLSRSVPFLCYIIMLSLNMLNWKIPEFVVTFAGIVGQANAFMAMLMIGVGFKLEGERSKYRTIFQMLLIRYGMGSIFAAVFYFLLPFALEIRQALVILTLSPIGAAVPGFTEELKSDVGMSSALNSMTILISIVITVIMLSVML